jgi:hypothetical protein
VASSRLKNSCFDGTEAQLLTAQMMKVLQERRERLSRILAGMDPDDIGGGREGKNDRDTSPTEHETTTVDDHTDEMSSSTQGALSPYSVQFDDTLEPSFTSLPPTLQEIHEAFDTEDSADSRCEDAARASKDFEAADSDEITRQIHSAVGVVGSVTNLDYESPTGGYEPIRSPVDSKGFRLSPIRRAFSFEDHSRCSAKEKSPSIRISFSFDSIFPVESTPSRTLSDFNLHNSCKLSKCGSTLPSDAFPVNASTMITEASTDVNDSQVLGDAKTLVSLYHSTALGSATDEAEQHVPFDPVSSPVATESDESPQPLNFFPPCLLKARKSPLHVVTVDEDDDDDDSLSDTPFSTTSTLTTREERTGYLHNLTALQVRRPVARYPPDEMSSDPPLHPKSSCRTSGLSVEGNRVQSPHPGILAEDSKNAISKQVSPAISRTLVVDEEDQSVGIISDASSFDGTYDDTLTSGYLSAGGTSDKLNSLTGDDWTELSILLPAHQSFDESLEDGASVDRLLPPPTTSSIVSTLIDNEMVTLDRLPAILSPSLSSVIQLESCLLSSSAAIKETKAQSVKKVAFAEVILPPEHPASACRRTRKPPLLFVTDDHADSLCRANGGLYSILLASGFNAEPKLEVREASSLKQPSPSAVKVMRLNPDFRCGAQGSTYDICLQSGFDLTSPWKWTKKRKFLPVRGGLFDMAQRSGLTKDKLHSRTPLVIKTIPLSKCRDDDAEVLPEDVSDYECGATGNLYLAFESGGGDYVSKGSLYYLATRSGFKLNQ